MNTLLKFRNLIELTKHFSTELKCVTHLEQLRWNGQRFCPHCASVKTYQCKGHGKYICGDCKERFSVTTGTFFENTKIPLTKWFVAMYLCLTHKKGISSCQLSRDISVTQKTAWFMLHRIRALAVEKAPQMLTGVVEGDATYVGGKEKNRHKSKKHFKEGQGSLGYAASEDKAPVFGLVQRGGKVVAKYVPQETLANVTPFMLQHVDKRARIITDDHTAYRKLRRRFKHDTINHSEKVYVVGDVHTNTIENYWSVLKWTIVGSYKHVSRKHIQRYLHESCYRFNTRTVTSQARFDAAISNCHGRLTYKKLISKSWDIDWNAFKTRAYSGIAGGK